MDTIKFLGLYRLQLTDSSFVIFLIRYKKHSAAKDLSTKSAAELKSIFGNCAIPRNSYTQHRNFTAHFVLP